MRARLRAVRKLATVASQLGKRATIFVAKRAHLHPRTLMAKRLGAKIEQVSPGYLNVVQARAIKYSHQTGAVLAPFGFDIPGAAQAIAQAALSIGIQPDEVWCAGGSGVLARGLAQAWPNASCHVVQVGRALSPNDVAGATVHEYSKPFKWAIKKLPPFPSDPHYDAKAWEFCLAHKGFGARDVLERHRTGTTLTWLTDNRAIGRRQPQRSDNFRRRI
jgi:hypothetical protein